MLEFGLGAAAKTDDVETPGSRQASLPCAGTAGTISTGHIAASVAGTVLDSSVPESGGDAVTEFAVVEEDSCPHCSGSVAAAAEGSFAHVPAKPGLREVEDS